MTVKKLPLDSSRPLCLSLVRLNADINPHSSQRPAGANSTLHLEGFWQPQAWTHPRFLFLVNGSMLNCAGVIVTAAVVMSAFCFNTRVGLMLPDFLFTLVETGSVLTN